MLHRTVYGYNRRSFQLTRRRYYWHDEPVDGKNVTAVAAALNRNVMNGLNDVREGLDQYFSRHAAREAMAEIDAASGRVKCPRIDILARSRTLPTPGRHRRAELKSADSGTCPETRFAFFGGSIAIQKRAFAWRSIYA
jgi:hypothetical protein